MNKDRKSRLSDVQDSINNVIGDLQDIIDEEQEALDNLPDSLQYSERGMRMQQYIDSMEELATDLYKSAESVRQILR